MSNTRRLIFDQNIQDISLDEASHTYRNATQQVYLSCTQFIGEFEHKFDKVGEAIKYAKKNGNTPQYWMEQWDKINKDACDNGNEKHNYLELNTNKFDSKIVNVDDDIFLPKSITDIVKVKFHEIDLYSLEHSELKETYPYIYNDYKQDLLDGWRIYSEKIVYDSDHLLAGKIDKLIIKGDLAKIRDYKTNKDELKFTSGYYKKENGIKTNIWVDKDERFKRPINDIQQCKGNIYTLQLNIYQYMVELYGFTVVEKKIYHIRPNGVIPYYLGNMQGAVQKMLKHRKNQLLNAGEVQDDNPFLVI
jgi:hypothetical protein